MRRFPCVVSRAGISFTRLGSWGADSQEKYKLAGDSGAGGLESRPFAPIIRAIASTRTTARKGFAAALRDAKMRLGRSPRIPLRFIRGYFRSFPPGRGPVLLRSV